MAAGSAGILFTAVVTAWIFLLGTRVVLFNIEQSVDNDNQGYDQDWYDVGKHNIKDSTLAKISQTELYPGLKKGQLFYRAQNRLFILTRLSHGLA